MGPYAIALSDIVINASKNRKDINPSDFSKCLYYRGTGMTEPQIEEYRQLAKDGDKMRLYGWTATSRKLNEAQKFAFSNEYTCAKRVAFHIHWASTGDHYFMNAGAFDHEEEILLSDGSSFIVLSVLDEEYELYELQGLPEPDSKYNGAKCVI